LRPEQSKHAFCAVDGCVHDDDPLLGCIQAIDDSAGAPTAVRAASAQRVGHDFDAFHSAAKWLEREYLEEDA
jgi:hypothetical protein